MADDYASIVEQAYINETGRASDPEGAAYWTGLLESGAISPGDLSSLFSGTAEGTTFDQAAARAAEGAAIGQAVEPSSAGTGPNLFDKIREFNQMNPADGGIASLGSGTTAGQVAPTTAPELRSFLEGQYQSEFGRQFDAPGLDYWADQIQKGNITKEQVAEIFSKSPEGLKYDIANLAAGKTTDVGFLPSDLLKRYSDLQAAYQTAVYRPGDVEGLKYWLANPTDYAKALGGSDEAFIQEAYRNTLKYAPDPEGLKYWVGQLAAGKVTRAGLPTALMNATKKAEEEKKKIEQQKIVADKQAVAGQRSQYLYDFGNFPIVAGTRTTADGRVVPTVNLNLKQRPKVSLGIKAFAPLSLTGYEYDPSSVSLFGGNRLFGGTGMTSGKSVSLFGNPGMAQAASTGAAQEEVVAAANGGMISSDPVMRRAMFKAGGPVSSVGTGITSTVASPEENAKALQTMFAPGFRSGGEVQYFQEGGEAVDEERVGEQAAEMSALERLRAQTRNPEPRFKPVMEVFRENRTLPIDREQAYTGRSMRGENVDVVQSPYAGGMEGFMPPQMQDVSAPPAPRYSAEERARLARQAAADQIAEREMYRQAEEDQRLYRGAAAAAPAETAPSRATAESAREPVKDRLTLRLEELKAEREANKEKRRENQLLALMQAGFAAASGRSSNALANIAAGGISGVQTLAELNKDVRAEDRALRREILETELTQERMREAAAERRAGREQTAAERQRTLLQTVSSNARQEISSISQLIGTEEGKLLTPGITEEQKAPIKSEIARLKNQREAALEQMYGVYESLGIRRPRTVEQESPDFKFLGQRR
jgi:hypothetical protein